MNKSNAITSGNYTSIGNLINSSDKSKIDIDTYLALINALGMYDTTARNAVDISTTNGGKPIVFQMGEVNGKPINWQVVYQVGDIITVWMTNCYTVEYYNNSGGNVYNSALLDYSTGPYSSYTNYSQSVLRDVTAGIYSSLTTSYPVIANIVKSPLAAGATWQQTQTEDIYYSRASNPDSSYAYKNNYYLYAHHNGLDSYVGQYTGWSNDLWNTSDTPYNDEFWIPSYYEVYNATDHPLTTAGEVSSQDSFWGLTAADRGFSQTAIDGSYTNNCWLRSGYSGDLGAGLVLYTDGDVEILYVNFSNLGVRPAAHLSLSKLLENTDYIITTNVNNDTMGTTKGDGVFNKENMESTTIAATPYIGYIFNYWIEESTGNKIYSNPYTFTVTKTETYTAYFSAITINIKTENSGAEILSQIADNTPTTYNFAIKFNTSNYLTQIKFSGDSVPRTLKSAGAKFCDVANCTTVDYSTNTEGSKLYISVLDPTASITITLYFTNTAQNYKAASGSGVDTVAVQSTLGGSAELVGDDYANLATGDTITVVARYKLNGYQFDGWYVDGVQISTDLSVRLTYNDTIKGKIIVARFSKIDSKTNTDTDNTNDFY